MNQTEKGFLLLTSKLGDPRRKPLTPAQLRGIAQGIPAGISDHTSRELTVEDLIVLGFDASFSKRVEDLLNDEAALTAYCAGGEKSGCRPLTRVSGLYPAAVRRRLGLKAPGCLWAKGDITNLYHPAVAVVGSRDLRQKNEGFAKLVGSILAEKGIVLVSGNARGADRTAQKACLDAGGRVISVVADELWRHDDREHVLYLSENEFDAGFSSERALSRNRIIHSFGLATVVIQSTFSGGGTWSGTKQNLKNGWNTVACYQDGSRAAKELLTMGAVPVDEESILNLEKIIDRDQQLTWKL